MQDVSAGVTELLAAWSQGDRSALEKLLPFIERELHQIAHRQMSRERPGHTLQTTALVNEAYLRLVDQTQTDGAMCPLLRGRGTDHSPYSGELRS